MNNPQTLPVEGVPVKMSKIELFRTSLKKILPHSDPSILFAEKTVQNAMVIVFHPLSGERLRALNNLSDSWNLELMLGVNGLGCLQLEFNLKSDK